MRRRQKVFKPSPNPKNGPLGPQKVKNDPKIQSKSNVRIERNKENESCSTTWEDPKTVFEPYPNPKNSSLGPQKVKNDSKIKSKSNVKMNKARELKFSYENFRSYSVARSFFIWRASRLHKNMAEYCWALLVGLTCNLTIDK